MSKAQELATLLEKMKSEGWSTQNEDQAAALLRTQDALLQQALEALEWDFGGEPCGTQQAINAIKEHLK